MAQSGYQGSFCSDECIRRDNTDPDESPESFDSPSSDEEIVIGSVVASADESASNVPMNVHIATAKEAPAKLTGRDSSLKKQPPGLCDSQLKIE